MFLFQGLLCNGTVSPGNQNDGGSPLTSEQIPGNLTVTSDRTLRKPNGSPVLSERRDTIKFSGLPANSLSQCMSYSQLARADTSTTSDGLFTGQSRDGAIGRTGKQEDGDATPGQLNSTDSDTFNKDLDVNMPEIFGSRPKTTKKHIKDLCESDAESYTNPLDNDSDSLSYRHAHIASSGSKQP